jgi:hypothetical protein
MFASGNVSIDFTQSLVDQYLDEWQYLQSAFHNFTLNHTLPNSIVWRWSASGVFTVHSLHE